MAVSPSAPHSDWLDPRPPRSERRPAPRSNAITGRRLVFFDNSKLSPPYDRYMPVVPPILARIESMGIVIREYSDLLIDPISNHAARIARWKEQGVDGVFFGLCDVGVTQPTLLHAVAAEAAGIPSVVLCIEQGIDLAAVSANFMMPGLPLVLLAGDRLSSPAEFTAAATIAAQEVAEALTASADQLQARAKANFPYLGGLAQGDGDAASYASFADFARAQRMTDGLPVVTPTAERVARTIAASGKKRDHILIPSMSPGGASLSVERAAICAVMAGCTPERFPLVVAALEAMADPEYQLHLATVTTHPGGHLVLISGPAAAAQGVASGRGCMGPGHEANATIGRAVMLTLLNVGRAIPGLSTLSPFGSPAQFTYCFADVENGAFPPLHTAVGKPDNSIAWVFKCESPRNVLDHLSEDAESLLLTIAKTSTSIGSNNAYMPSDLLVALNPEHAQILVRAGWDRKRVQQFIWEHARNRKEDLIGRGAKAEYPAEWKDWDEFPVTPSPDRIWVVIAGGPGPQSMVAIPWGYCRPVWHTVAQT